MAIQISGTNVIDNNRRIAIGVSSIYGEVTAGGTQTISNREIIYVTSDSQTITLPTTANPGNEVEVVVGNYTAVAISTAGSTNRIMGLNENMTIDVAYAPVRLIYIDATRGWVIS